MSSIRPDRLKQQVEENITQRTMSGLDSGVETQDDDGSGAKSARQKAHGNKGKSQGKHGVHAPTQNSSTQQADRVDISQRAESTSRAVANPNEAAAVHPQSSAEDSSPRSGTDTAGNDSALNEVSDFATNPHGSTSSLRSGAQAAPQTGKNQTAADVTKNLDANDALNSSSGAANQASQLSSAAGANSESAPSSAVSDATPETSSNEVSTSSETLASGTASTSSVSAPTETDPAVQAAQEQLADDLQSATATTDQITQDTDNLINALDKAGRKDDAASIISSLTSDPSAREDAAAAAIVAAAKNGINIDDSGKDKAAAVKAQAVVQKKMKEEQKAKQEAAQQAAQQQAAQQSSENQSAGGGGGSTGGSSGTSGGGSSGGGTVNSAPVNVPAGTKANTPSYGQSLPWNQFQQKSYGSPTPFNNEEETYTTNGSNFQIDKDGNAVLTAKPNGPGGAYTSGRIEGKPIGQLPKYIEFNAQMPSGQGMWPAVWLCGPDWPTHGEVDIAEQVANEKQTHMSTHWGASQGNSTHNTQQPVNISDRDTAFHRYGAMLTDTGVQFYLDGKKVGNPVTMPGDWKNYAPTMVPVINLAVGGWGGKADKNVGEKQMLVKSVSTADTPPSE